MISRHGFFFHFRFDRPEKLLECLPDSPIFHQSWFVIGDPKVFILPEQLLQAVPAEPHFSQMISYAEVSELLTRK